VWNIIRDGELRRFTIGKMDKCNDPALGGEGLVVEQPRENGGRNELEKRRVH